MRPIVFRLLACGVVALLSGCAVEAAPDAPATGERLEVGGGGQAVEAPPEAQPSKPGTAMGLIVSPARKATESPALPNDEPEPISWKGPPPSNGPGHTDPVHGKSSQREMIQPDP